MDLNPHELRQKSQWYIEIAHRLNELADALEKGESVGEGIDLAYTEPKKPKNYAPRIDQLREFLKYHGPSFRGKINELSDLPKGTIDTLLASGDFLKDKNGRWYHPEDYEPDVQ